MADSFGDATRSECRSKRRPARAFTLVEIIASMIASTLIVVTLVGTIQVAGMLLDEVPAQQAQIESGDVRRWISDDLRYASEVVQENGRLQISRTRPDTGQIESVVYRNASTGLSRQVGLGATADVDKRSSTISIRVDAVEMEQQASNAGVHARVHAISTAFTQERNNEIEIAVPDGCIPGDLMLLVIGMKFDRVTSLDMSGWTQIAIESDGDLQLQILQNTYATTFPASINISAAESANYSIMMLAIENSAANPFIWIDSRTDSLVEVHGFRVGSINPIDDPTLSVDTLNLQFYISDSHPFDKTLGSPVFVTQAILESGNRDSFGEADAMHSLGLATRHGPIPADFAGDTSLQLHSSASVAQISLGIAGAP